MSQVQLKYKKLIPRSGNIKIICSGKEYFDTLLFHIRNANHFIHVQYYIIDDDETGWLIVHELIRAAQRGVQIHVMADGYASQNLSKKFIKSLTEAGIQFKFFQPLLKSKYFYLGRRLHHKIFVADLSVAIIGGLNISNRYNDMPDKPGWLDFALEVTGETVRDLCILCWKSWNGFPGRMGLTPCENKNVSILNHESQDCTITILRNDWVRRKIQISASYIRLCQQAKYEIVILSSYFLPDLKLRRHLIKCSQRGVCIKIITAGQSDVVIAKAAERWLYDWLLRYNIKVYEYQKKILHGKLGICDEDWFTLGSYNVNDISAYASIELNLEIKGTSKSKELKRILNQILKEDCTEITFDHHKNKTPWYIQFINFCSYEIIRMLYYIFTFYYQQEKNNNEV